MTALAKMPNAAPDTLKWIADLTANDYLDPTGNATLALLANPATPLGIEAGRARALTTNIHVLDVLADPGLTPAARARILDFMPGSADQGIWPGSWRALERTADLNAAEVVAAAAAVEPLAGYHAVDVLANPATPADLALRAAHIASADWAHNNARRTKVGICAIEHNLPLDDLKTLGTLPDAYRTAVAADPTLTWLAFLTSSNLTPADLEAVAWATFSADVAAHLLSRTGDRKVTATIAANLRVPQDVRLPAVIATLTASHWRDELSREDYAHLDDAGVTACLTALTTADVRGLAARLTALLDPVLGAAHRSSELLEHIADALRKVPGSDLDLQLALHPSASPALRAEFADRVPTGDSEQDDPDDWDYNAAARTHLVNAARNGILTVPVDALEEIADTDLILPLALALPRALLEHCVTPTRELIDAVNHLEGGFTGTLAELFDDAAATATP